MKPSPAVARPLRSAGVPRASALNSAPALVAAVDDVEEQYAVALGAVGRPHDVDVGDVFDHAPGIARREADVLDAGIGGRARVDLAIGLAGQPLIGAGRAEARPGEGRLGLGDLDARDARLGGCGGERRRSGSNGSELE
jgi:hypothetical protein